MPACLALVWGLIRARGEAAVFVVSLFAVLLGFFVFLYNWEAKRFLVYPVWMAGLLLAWGLARMPRFGAGAGRPCHSYHCSRGRAAWDASPGRSGRPPVLP